MCPFYIPWVGTYGTTLAIDLSLVLMFLGAFIVSSTPWLSKKITTIRGKMIPFQGVFLTLSLLLIFGSVIQLVLLGW
jgi:hypothetical protein